MSKELKGEIKNVCSEEAIINNDLIETPDILKNNTWNLRLNGQLLHTDEETDTGGEMTRMLHWKPEKWAVWREVQGHEVHKEKVSGVSSQ